jgi:hypothetical protein
LRTTAVCGATVSISPRLPIGSLECFSKAFKLRQISIQYTCLQSICASPPEEPFEVALWQYAVTTLAVVLGRFSVYFVEKSVVDPQANCCSNGSYLPHVGGDAPAVSLEKLPRDSRLLRRATKASVYPTPYFMVHSCEAKQAAAISLRIGIVDIYRQQE